MAITIRQAFEQFLSRLEITSLQEERVSARHSGVRDVLADQFTLRRSFLTGSYKRHTMIAPLKEADIDLFAVLDPLHYPGLAVTDFLESVRLALREEYPRTPRFSKNGQAITISFTDFKIDVVPAFDRQGGGYLIPDIHSERWIATDPKAHEKLASEQNSWHHGSLVPLIKMIKCWNRAHSKLLRSFHLENLVIKVLHQMSIDDWPSALRYFFQKAKDELWHPLPDPAGYSGNLSSYLDDFTKREIYNRFLAAYDRAAEAEKLVRADRTEAAIGRYRVLFDETFPAYG